MPVELYANDFSTNFAVAVGLADTTVTVEQAAPAALQGGQFRIAADGEIMLVIGGQSTTTWTLQRAQEGTVPTTHPAGPVLIEGVLQARVVHVLTAASMALLPVPNHDHSTATLGGVTLSPAGGINRKGVITVTLDGDKSNFDPNGKDTASVWRFDCGGVNRIISGFMAPTVDGANPVVFNVSTLGNLTLPHNNNGSSAGNRFFGPNNGSVVLNPNDGIHFWYDDVSMPGIWRPIGLAPAG